MSAVLYSSSDRIGVITLNRPEARNAVNREVALGLEGAVDRLEDDPDVWVGVLTANTAEQERPVFCAGADLKIIQETGSAASLDTERGGFGGFVYRDRTKPIDARRAFDLGLVSRLVEPGDALEEAMRVARPIVAAAPLAVRASRRVVLSAVEGDDETLARVSKELLDELLTSEDATIGLRAFAEKREPQWQGR